MIGTLFVVLKTENGGTAVVSDSITLVQNGDPAINSNNGNCTLAIGKSYKSKVSNSVYYIDLAHYGDGTVNTSIACSKRAFSNSHVFFTYFTNWDSVTVVDEKLLSAIPNDTLSFMPYGPLYNPQYGALVKVVTDPKVYLLLNDTKFWITSEPVFTALNYAWNWIEDVSIDLLNKYKVGTEITNKDTHPNYTLVKYANSADVYRLEPNPANPSEKVERHILNEKSFNALNFRWDRIVTIEESEIYPDGDILE